MSPLPNSRSIAVKGDQQQTFSHTGSFPHLLSSPEKLPPLPRQSSCSIFNRIIRTSFFCGVVVIVVIVVVVIVVCVVGFVEPQGILVALCAAVVLSAGGVRKHVSKKE